MDFEIKTILKWHGMCYFGLCNFIYIKKKRGMEEKKSQQKGKLPYSAIASYKLGSCSVASF